MNVLSLPDVHLHVVCQTIRGRIFIAGCSKVYLTRVPENATVIENRLIAAGGQFSESVSYLVTAVSDRSGSSPYAVLVTYRNYIISSIYIHAAEELNYVKISDYISLYYETLFKPSELHSKS